MEDPAGWFGPDTYPLPALEERQKGRVGFRLAIDATGAVRRCDITRSSGFSALDAGTCALMMDRARFTPALDATGKPVPGSFVLAVNWELPAEGPEVPLAPGSWTQRIRLGQGTTIAGCSFSIQGSVPSGFPSQACAPQVLEQIVAPAAQRLHPEVPATLWILNSVAIDGFAPLATVDVPEGFDVTDRLELDFQIGADGKTRQCKGTRSVGAPPRVCPQMPAYAPETLAGSIPRHGRYTMVAAIGPATP